MFFEAPSIGCCKATCDVTKVTYNMHSCDTCYMSREMMEMEGRDSAKCQKSKRRDMRQKMNSDHLPYLIESQNVQRAKTCCSE